MSGDEPAFSPTSNLGRKIGAAGILAVLVWVGLSAYGDMQQVLGQLETFRWSSLVLALGLSLGNFALRAIRWQYYLRHLGLHLGHFESSLVFLAGFVMTLTPGKAGEILKSFLLKWTRDTPLAVTSPVLLAERLTDLLALLGLIAWGAGLLPGGSWVSLICVALCLGLVLLCSWQKFGFFCLALLRRIPRLRKVDRLEQAYLALLKLTTPGPLLGGSIVALLAWFMQVLAVLVIVLGLHEGTVTVQAAALSYCGSMVAGVLTLLPGGIGATEASMAGLLQVVGGGWATPAAAVTVTLLARLATLWWAILIGSVALTIHRRLTGWTMQDQKVYVRSPPK